MDPTKALERIRIMVGLLQHRGNDSPFDGEELADAVQDLDEWLTKGGFLPEQWPPDLHRRIGGD